MKTYVHVLLFAEFLLEWGMFHTKTVEKIKRDFYVHNLFSPKIVPFMR